MAIFKQGQNELSSQLNVNEKCLQFTRIITSSQVIKIVLPLDAIRFKECNDSGNVLQ